MVDGIYGFQWMDNQAAPDEILELVASDCKKEKCIEQCQCVLLQIPCQMFANAKANVIMKSLNNFL